VRPDESCAHDRQQRKVYRIDLTAEYHPELLFEATPGEADEFVWISNDTFIYQNGTSIYQSSILEHAAKHLFDLPTTSAGLQYDKTTDTLAWTAEVWMDGEFSHPKPDRRKLDTGLVYEELSFR
jgi:hypothetical protein